MGTIRPTCSWIWRDNERAGSQDGQEGKTKIFHSCLLVRRARNGTLSVSEGAESSDSGTRAPEDLRHMGATLFVKRLLEQGPTSLSGGPLALLEVAP